MDTLTVAHFVNPFLPVTQNWIYHFLRFNTCCRNIVLCRTLENTSQFPLERVFPAFPWNSPAARIDIFISRIMARYPSAFYLSIIAREKPQVLHGHFSWESWRNIKIVQKTRLPLVTTFYGLDVNKLSKKWLWTLRYSRLFDLGDVFTVEGPFMANALETIGCPGRKIRIVPLGVDIDKLSGIRVQKNTETIRILFVGLEREKKGSSFAAAAFAKTAQKNHHCELHVIGDGPFASPMKRFLHEKGVLQRCVFHGYVPFETYYHLLGQMDIVLTPSVVAKNGDTEGGAPVVAIEAQAAGIPVVGTKHCDIPNVVIDNETGLLCEERDIDSLACNLNLLTENHEKRRAMGRAASIHAAHKFHIERQIRELNEIYRSIR